MLRIGTAAERGRKGDATLESHTAAVAALRSSYAAIPRDQTVRLRKATSNLFRSRTGRSAGLHVSGLDVSGLDRVLSVDPVARTADVQGMCTYEHLVDATLPHGLMPLVVPQLRTITLGGAVSGLGIESSSFRHGMPHESVLEMDVLTGTGEILTCRPDGPHAELFHAFPNSYGSLGYATRLRIELMPVAPFVALRHVAFHDLDALAEAMGSICDSGVWAEQRVDFLDGVVFAPDEAYLTLGTWAETLAGCGVRRPSDYTGQQIYYQSIRERARDVLTTLDYIWRWDTDWFWCSRAFGAQVPAVRRCWPRRWRRSDVYHRIVGLENRFGVWERLERLRGFDPAERVIQDVEIPVDRTADFLRWFDDTIGMRPVWLCPVRLREAGTTEGRPWPLYPLTSGACYVNVGFWGNVRVPHGSPEGMLNRRIEAAVAEHDGHKSLYSDAFYDEPTFDALYGGPSYRSAKERYDPDHRLTGLYEKAVRRR